MSAYDPWEYAEPVQQPVLQAFAQLAFTLQWLLAEPLRRPVPLAAHEGVRHRHALLQALDSAADQIVALVEEYAQTQPCGHLQLPLALLPGRRPDDDLF